MMKILTVVMGCLIILASLVIMSSGFSDSLNFSSLVNMNWTTSTAFHKHPLVSYMDTDHQTKVYAIIFDAGSTGTRIHVYKFRYSPHNESYPYILVDELFEEIKPGLSSHAHQPADVRPGLLHLLQCAKRKIPKALWIYTHMVLKATAGLRLLPESQAQQLLAEVKNVLEQSGFRLVPNGVSIMSGLDEGVLSWVTVNFLLQRVRQPSISYGTLDLGGGSLQITFVPAREGTVSSLPSKSSFMHRLSVAGNVEQIYSHSYLGLGLMSARFHLLTNVTTVTQLHTHQDLITSDCVPHGYHGHWKFGGVRYSVQSSVLANTSMFDYCYNKSKILVTQSIPVHSPPELTERQFYVFSYFYDRVKDTGLDVDSLPLNKITPAKYESLAREACSPHYRKAYRKPFLCLDLTYIFALLKDGFKFRDSTTLYITKAINNIELGWALGAVFDLLHGTEKV